jgi:CheY-specific phosphatase CheX
MTISQAIAPAVRSEKELFALLEVASTEVSRMMAGSELERTNDARWKGAELTAMVGLAGDLCGLLSVPCSQDSARQVAALMLGLAPEKAAELLGASGYAEFRPMASNDTQEGRAANRRVDVVIPRKHA